MERGKSIWKKKKKKGGNGGREMTINIGEKRYKYSPRSICMLKWEKREREREKNERSSR